MRKKQKSVDFSNLLSSKRIPIVVLDERWHKLFEKEPKSSKIIELEKKLNDLLKQQGRLVTEGKSLKSAKNQLMDGIVANMNVDLSPAGKLNGKKLQKSQKLIQEINGKLKETDNDLAEIPYRIREANSKLVVEGINQCYQKLEVNADERNELDLKMNAMREELKHMIVRKQDLEEENANIYTYMHDVLGSEIMETLDQKYGRKK